MRKTPFIIGEFYHVYNRGTDHRKIVEDYFDRKRFLQSVLEFNTLEPIGSIYEEQFRKNSLGTPTTELKFKQKLVNIIAICVNPNHYHLLLEQISDKGIEKFMQKLGGGYTRYFNEKYNRNGVLFQGKFKAIHVDSDEYLLFVSAYINLNDRIHKVPSGIAYSSWDEYIGTPKCKEICSKDIILDRFRNKKEYRKFAEDVALDTSRKREEDKEFAELLLE